MCRSRETVAKRKFLVKIVRSIERNTRFGSLFLEKLRKPRTKCSFWKGVVLEGRRSDVVSEVGVVLCSTE